MASNVDVKTMRACIMERVSQMRRVPHDFLWDTTDINAGAAETSFLEYGNVSTVLGGTLRSGYPTTTAAENNQIVGTHIPTPKPGRRAGSLTGIRLIPSKPRRENVDAGSW